MQGHAFAVAFLPAFIRNLLDTKSVANTHDLAGEASMQALAMGREFAVLVGKSSSRGKVAFAVLPSETLLPAFCDASLLVVVLGLLARRWRSSLRSRRRFLRASGL